jgi:hypothetical protein
MYHDLKRRKYQKIEKPYMARLRIKQYEGLEMEYNDWDSVTLHNLSAGGTFFIYNKYLGIGTLLDFKIEVSKSEPPVNPVGKIIRIEQFQLPPYSMFCITIKFIDIGRQEKEVINTAVEEALVGQ